MSFTEVVCWKPTSINAIAPIDAAGVVHDTAGDDAVFLATHHPIPIRRAAVDDPENGVLIDEEELLRDFSAPLGTDPHVFVVAGQVGTGKSHVVKWLHARCADRKDWHHVYVPKRDTNLRRVIASILDGRRGPKVDELRKQLDEARTSLTDTAEAARRVLTELAHAVEFPAGGPSTDKLEITVRKHVPNLLRDPKLSTVLLRDGGAILRITRLGIEGLEDGDEQDLFLAEEDLPITASPHMDPAILDEASGPAREAVLLLDRSAKVRAAAIAVLNEELARAKARVLLGTGLDLVGVFTEVRRELAEAGLELALYVEDLVLLHGIDRELAQVFTEGRPSDGSLCGMRVAIAVTTGYLATGALDTLRTRSVEHSLDLGLGDDAEVPLREARTFVGRYLNAIRLGPERLEEARRTGGDEWVPNRCTTCPHREPCHDAFGSDELGHGLYPLNATAADQLIHLAGGGSDRFDPREVVRGAVRDPLDVASDEMSRRAFPSARFGAALDARRSAVPFSVQNALLSQRDGERHVTVQAFWAPPGSTEVRRLNDGLYTAFALEPPRDAVVVTADDAPTAPRRASTPPPQADDPIDRWATGGAQLPTAAALKTRDLVFRAIVEGIRSGSYGLSVTTTGSGRSRRAEIGGLRLQPARIHIEGAAGGAGMGEAYEPVIERSVASAGLIADLHAADQADGSWEGLGPERYAAVRRRIDDWVDAIVVAARSRQDASAAVTRILFATSQPAVGAVRLPGSRLEAVFAAEVPDRNPERTRAFADWVAAAERARVTAFDALRQSGSAAKSTGAASIIDAAPLLASLRVRTPARAITGPHAGPPDLATVQQTLEAAQARAARDEWAMAQEVTRRVIARLGDDDRWPGLADSIQRAVDLAHDNHLLALADDRDRVGGLRAAIPVDAIDLARRVASRTAVGPEDLWDVLVSPVGPIKALDRYLTAVAPILAHVEESLGAIRTDVPDDEVRVSDLTTDLHALADGLAAVGGART